MIKDGLFKYLGLTSTEFDISMKEDIIENTNNKMNVEVSKLIDDLMQHKKVSNYNLDENELKIDFDEAFVFLKREWSNKFKLNEEEKSDLSECLKKKKIYKHKNFPFVVISVVKRNYILKKKIGVMMNRLHYLMRVNKMRIIRFQMQIYRKNLYQ